MSLKKRLLVVVIAVAALLLIPIIAMQFTNEVNWSLFDFIVAGTLLTGTGLLGNLILIKVTQWRWRTALGLLLLFALLLVWIELAVGLFGTPFSGD